MIPDNPSDKKYIVIHVSKKNGEVHATMQEVGCDDRRITVLSETSLTIIQLPHEEVCERPQ